MNYIPNLKYKTVLCNSWMNGRLCNKGLNCFFAHGPSDLRTLQQNQSVSLARTQALATGSYKTVYCKFYNKGLCELGDACTFAHRRSEKRAKTTHPLPIDPLPYPQSYQEIPYTYGYDWQNYQQNCYYYMYGQQIDNGSPFASQQNSAQGFEQAIQPSLKTSIETTTGEDEERHSGHCIYESIEEGHQVIICEQNESHQISQKKMVQNQ